MSGHLVAPNLFELCRVLRERSAARPFLPIVFLTSVGSFEQRMEGLAAGGDDFVLKPYQPAELIAVIRAHLLRAAFREKLQRKAKR